MLSVLNFFRAHWQSALVVLVIIVAAVAFHQRESTSADELAKLNASHQQELDEVKQAQADEVAQHQQELDALHAAYSKIEADYADASAQLQERQGTEQKQLIKQYGNDAAGMAALLGSRYGFTVSR
jgi:uncharacterized membrane-anchored protein YhcB (DUF1043 family)